MEGERTVAGIRCSEVLAELSEFLDGRLSHERAAELQAHVEGCDVCERFGADFAAVIKVLRALKPPAPLEAGVRERLARAIDEAT